MNRQLVVSCDAANAFFNHKINHRFRLRTVADHIPQADQVVDIVLPDIRINAIERLKIPVNV